METNIRRLQHFVALAEEKSFARAAQRVHLSQPALSRSIQALESDLGLLLLDRAVRRVTLTSAGRRVVERAHRVLFEARCLERDVDLIKSHELGEVTFGVGPHPAAIFLADVLAKLGASHPRLRIVAQVSSWKVLTDQLQREEIDFFVTDHRTIPLSDEIKTRPLPAQSAGWYVRHGHPLQRKRQVSIADTRPYRFAFVPLPESILHEIRIGLGLTDEPDAGRLIECNNFFVLKDLAANSDTILFAADAAVREEVRAGKLARLKTMQRPEPVMDLSIAFLGHRTLSPEAEIAIDAISSIVKRLAPDGKGAN